MVIQCPAALAAALLSREGRGAGRHSRQPPVVLDFEVGRPDIDPWPVSRDGAEPLRRAAARR